MMGVPASRFDKGEVEDRDAEDTGTRHGGGAGDGGDDDDDDGARLVWVIRG